MYMRHLKSLKLSRLRSLLPGLQRAGRSLARTTKYLFVGSVLFIFIPQLFVYAEVGPRLNANIYDFYSFLLLIWLSYKAHIISSRLQCIEDASENGVYKEQIVADITRVQDVENLKRLKKKLDRRRKKPTSDG